MRWLILSVLLVSNLAQAELAYPPLPINITRTVLVDGFGTTPALARQDAFRTAIERAVGVALTTETQTNNYQLIRDTTASYSQAHITNFAVAMVEQRGQMFRTQVWVTVKSIN